MIERLLRNGNVDLLRGLVVVVVVVVRSGLVCSGAIDRLSGKTEAGKGLPAWTVVRHLVCLDDLGLAGPAWPLGFSVCRRTGQG